MLKRKKVFLIVGIALFFLLVCTTVLCVIPRTPYPGMQRVSSHIAHGNTANGDHHDEYEQLIILIMCNEHTDIMGIIDSEVFKAVVNDIRPE